VKRRWKKGTNKICTIGGKGKGGKGFRGVVPRKKSGGQGESGKKRGIVSQGRANADAFGFHSSWLGGRKGG